MKRIPNSNHTHAHTHRGSRAPAVIFGAGYVIPDTVVLWLIDVKMWHRHRKRSSGIPVREALGALNETDISVRRCRHTFFRQIITEGHLHFHAFQGCRVWTVRNTCTFKSASEQNELLFLWPVFSQDLLECNTGFNSETAAARLV